MSSDSDTEKAAVGENIRNDPNIEQNEMAGQREGEHEAIFDSAIAMDDSSVDDLNRSLPPYQSEDPSIPRAKGDGQSFPKSVFNREDHSHGPHFGSGNRSFRDDLRPGQTLPPTYRNLPQDALFTEEYCGGHSSPAVHYHINSESPVYITNNYYHDSESRSSHGETAQNRRPGYSYLDEPAQNGRPVRHYPSAADVPTEYRRTTNINQNREETKSDELILPGGIRVFKHKLIYKAGNGVAIYAGEKATRFDTHGIVVKFFSHSEQSMKEAEFLKALTNDKNVVHVYSVGTFQAELGDSIYIAMERCSYKTLFRHIKAGNEFDVDRALVNSLEIISGLGFIHSKGIAHGALTPSNILFADNACDQVKIAGFKVAENYQTSPYGTSPAPVNTMGYNAPEVVRCESLNDEKKCDIFSLGIVLVFVLSNGKHPYGELRWQHDYNIASGSKPDLDLILLPNGKQRDAVIDIIRKMLQHDPEARPNAHELLDSWRKNVKGSDLKKQSPTVSETAEDHETFVVEQEMKEGTVADNDETMLAPICPTELGDIDKNISEKLLLPKTKVEDIGHDGAKMDLLGCTLSLQPGAYPTPSPVEISVRSSNTDAPEGYIVASPELNCNNFGVPFKGLATITLPLHVIPEDGQVQIISKQDGNSDWEIMNVHPTLAGRKVTFEVPHFTPFKAIFKHVRWFNTYLSHYIFYRASTSELRGLTCIDDEKVKSDCIETLKEEGLKPWSLIPDQVILYGNEEVRYKYTCLSPEGPQLEPDIEVLKWVDVVPQKQNPFKFLPRPEQDIDIVDVRCVRTTSESESTSILALQWRTPEPEAHLGAGEIIPVAQRERQMIGRPQGEEPRLGPHRIVGNVEITMSTQEFYELHHNVETVYHIDPNRGKGKVLILNNEFRGQEGGERNGSEIDVSNLRGLWNRMGFNVDVKINLPAEEMRRACEEFAAIAQNISVLVVIVMSHGGKENGVEFVTGEDGNKLYTDEIISPFTSTSCPRLCGVPKVFMFQACRGVQPDELQDDPIREVQRIQSRDPERADMLIVYPSQSGSLSYRDPQRGSVLMNAVVNVFKRDAYNTHILELLTTVNSEVAPVGGRAHSVQGSNLVSFLRKKLFLFPGWP